MSIIIIFFFIREYKQLFKPIVIKKLFFDHEIIALIKIAYMTTCNNIYYFI